MDYCAGIDVSLELSSVCILDACGQIIREAKVASEPEALAAFLASLNLPLTRVGLEAGPLSQWLHAGLVRRESPSRVRSRCTSRSRTAASPAPLYENSLSIAEACTP